MASLRLTFPEKDQPTVIALTGARLTIGRLPFNTIQIIDRTVSGFHAELINEHGHYRLHDRGSSNGTYVNGQKVSDYHLNEACTIGFGTVEAQFNPEDVATNEEAETFPSRGEVNAVRQENVEMRATVAALREEIDALHKVPAASGDAAGATVSRDDYEKVVNERESLKEAQLRHEEEIGRLKTDLAILKRDRLNLQLAYDTSQRELEQLQRKLSGGGEEPALPPVEAAAVLAAQAGEMRIEVPKPAASASTPPTANPAESEETLVIEHTPDFAAEAPAASAGEPSPTAALPKAPASLGKFSKPVVPAGVPVKNVPLPSALTPKPQGTLGSGVRPVAQPTVTQPPGAKPNGPATTRLGQKPLPPPRQIPQATTKLNPVPVPVPKAGPKGTQKLTE